MITVAIAEDHQALIDGLTLLLKNHDTIKIISTALNGEELLAKIKNKQPHVVVTDIRMPKMDGIQATKRIKKLNPNIKVIAFTMFDQPDAIQQMLAAGADGYILKNSPLTTVEKAIEAVYNGKTFFDAAINISDFEYNTNNTQKSLLTKRQQEILHLIGQGKTSREIATLLFIGIHTVDTHRKNMARVLGLNGKGELLRYALDKKYKF